MAGGRTILGYAGRKTNIRRVLNAHTPGMPSKHEAWAGVQLDQTKTIVVNGSIKRRG